MRSHWLPTTALTMLLVGLLAPAHAFARIKLITLPVREKVEIRLDHPDVTLVEEERVVPLVRGVNQVDFSWANTNIDPDTIVFRMLGPEGDAELDARVLSVSYPPNEQALVWQVAATGSGPARVRISYAVGQLDQSYAYRAVADNDEKTLTLSQYVRIANNANEGFGEADVSLPGGQQVRVPVDINQTRQVLVKAYDDVEIAKTYTCDLAQFGWINAGQQKVRIPMHYRLVNKPDQGLGDAPLPHGKVRIFQDDGKGTTAFIGEDFSRFTPVGDETRLFLGVAQDVVVTRTIERNEQTRVAGQLYHREVVIKYEIENFKTEPITLDVAEMPHRVRNEVGLRGGRDPEWVIGDRTTFPGGINREDSTYERVVFHADLPARNDDGSADKVVHRLHLVFRNEW